jgi:hypothetical protein
MYIIHLYPKIQQQQQQQQQQREKKIRKKIKLRVALRISLYSLLCVKQFRPGALAYER